MRCTDWFLLPLPGFTILAVYFHDHEGKRSFVFAFFCRLLGLQSLLAISMITQVSDVLFGSFCYLLGLQSLVGIPMITQVSDVLFGSFCYLLGLFFFLGIPMTTMY